MNQPWLQTSPAASRRNWAATVLSGLAVLLSAAALIVALTRSGAGEAPSYTAAEKAEAKAKLCDQYRLAAHAVHIETEALDNTSLARVAMANGALMVKTASENPALESRYRNAALDLAATYENLVAIGTAGIASREEYLAAVDDSNVKDSAMQELCGD